MIPDNVEKIIMTKEDYDRNVEQLLYDKINAEQEVERLKENNQAMQEEMARTWKKLDEKENIIKEVREYATGDLRLYDNESIEFEISTRLLEILDKGKE